MSKRLLLILLQSLLFAAAAQAQPGPSFTSMTLPAGGVAVPYGADLQVTGGTPPYTFAVTTGSLPAGFSLVATNTGTVAAGHIFSANPAASGTFTFGVTVTDSAQLTATATISLTINTVPNTQASLLKGQYAFLERSFSESGSVEIAGGSLNFDGISSVTGVVDVNSAVNGVTLLDSVNGTYSVGPDNRGFINLTAQTCQSPPCNVSFAIAVGDVYRGLASTAQITRFVDDDGNDRIGAGELHLQDTTSFTQNIFAGTYAVEFTGQTPTLGRSVYAGLMTFDNAGNIPSVTFDVNDGERRLDLPRQLPQAPTSARMQTAAFSCPCRTPVLTTPSTKSPRMSSHTSRSILPRAATMSPPDLGCVKRTRVRLGGRRSRVPTFWSLRASPAAAAVWTWPLASPP